MVLSTCCKPCRLNARAGLPELRYKSCGPFSTRRVVREGKRALRMQNSLDDRMVPRLIFANGRAKPTTTAVRRHDLRKTLVRRRQGTSVFIYFAERRLGTRQPCYLSEGGGNWGVEGVETLWVQQQRASSSLRSNQREAMAVRLQKSSVAATTTATHALEGERVVGAAAGTNQPTLEKGFAAIFKTVSGLRLPTTTSCLPTFRNSNNTTCRFTQREKPYNLPPLPSPCS